MGGLCLQGGGSWHPGVPSLGGSVNLVLLLPKIKSCVRHVYLVTSITASK